MTEIVPEFINTRKENLAVVLLLSGEGKLNTRLSGRKPKTKSAIEIGVFQNFQDRIGH